MNRISVGIGLAALSAIALLGSAVVSAIYETPTLEVLANTVPFDFAWEWVWLGMIPYCLLLSARGLRGKPGFHRNVTLAVGVAIAVNSVPNLVIAIVAVAVSRAGYQPWSQWLLAASLISLVAASVLLERPGLRTVESTSRGVVVGLAAGVLVLLLRSCVFFSGLAGGALG